MKLGGTGKVDQRAERGFDGTCEVESGLFVKLDSMALCCLWSAKVRAGEKPDEATYRQPQLFA